MSYHCHVYKRIIIGTSLTQPLFLNAESRCLAEDLYCQLQETVIIWESDIIHRCPYFFIRSISVTILDTMIIGENLLFQIINKHTACGVDLMSSSEGLFLSHDSRSSKFETSNIELDMKNHFMLAENDFKFESILRIVNIYNNEIKSQVCSLI